MFRLKANFRAIRPMEICAVALLMLSGTAALANYSDPDWQGCSGAILSPADSVSHCDRLIASKISGGELALAHADRGLAFERQGKMNRAIGDLSAAIRLLPSAENYTLRAEAYFRAGQYRKALDDLKVVERQGYGDLAEFQYWRGLTERKLGDTKGAAVDLTAAARFDKRFAATDVLPPRLGRLPLSASQPSALAITCSLNPYDDRQSVRFLFDSGKSSMQLTYNFVYSGIGGYPGTAHAFEGRAAKTTMTDTAVTWELGGVRFALDRGTLRLTSTRQQRPNVWVDNPQWAGREIPCRVDAKRS